MAAGSGLLVDVGCPGIVLAGVTGKVHDGGAELLVAGKAEHDLLMLARPPRSMGPPGQAGQRLGDQARGPKSQQAKQRP
jgi:hypothetical protein